jgi:GNAT superfamily N-acetyltransferase
MSTDPHFLHNIAKSLEHPAVPPRLQLLDGRAFNFTVVRPEGQDELMSQLLPRLEGENWGIAEWASYAMLYPGFVVSIQRDGEDRSSGFLAFDTRVCIFGDQRSLKVSVTVEPQVVYVSPDSRGHGLGTAFVALLSSEIQHTLGLIERAMRTSLKEVPAIEVSLALEAECVSEEGARFVRMALIGCQEALGEFRCSRPGDNRWCADIDDRVDYADWADDEQLAAIPLTPRTSEGSLSQLRRGFR